MQYTVQHTTLYTYDQPVGLCHNVAKLLPRNTAEQIVIECDVQILPQPTMLHAYEDFFGNQTRYFAIQQPHKSLQVTVTSIIEKKVLPPILSAAALAMSWEEAQAQVAVQMNQEVAIAQYVLPTPATQANSEIAQFARMAFTPGKNAYQACKDLMELIFTQCTFQPGFSTISTPVWLVMKERKGVCQDFAHLAIACIRSVGLPVRYVSGYIETLPPKGKPKLVGVDASHAWFSVYLPYMGWVDFDPTNNQVPGYQHLTVGWGRDYFDVAPLKGVIQNSGPHQLTVSVDVRRTNLYHPVAAMEQ